MIVIVRLGDVNLRDVRSGSKAEVGLPDWRVGLTFKNGHAATASACRFRAKIGSPPAADQSLVHGQNRTSGSRLNAGRGDGRKPSARHAVLGER